jgi:predicted dehydrogenase
LASTIALVGRVLDSGDEFFVWFTQESGTSGGEEDLFSGVPEKQSPIIIHPFQQYEGRSMSIKSGITRRNWMKLSSLAGMGATIVPSRVFGANERLNIAFVGAGGKGWHAIKSLAHNRMVNMVAFADVDQRKAAEAYKAHPNVPRFTDFRVMLDKLGAQIDGVIISTPDHTHHYIARWCLNAGKPVYLEKPLTHNIAEARDLMALERETGLACQMGNQGHSSGGLVMLDAWVRSGALGTVQDVHAWCVPNWSFADVRPPTEPVPEHLDWEQWLGPAAHVPYSSKYCPASWRGWREFGGGALGDWACHNMDAPYTALDLDCPRLVELESTGPSKLSFPDSAKLTFTFPASAERGEVRVHWYQGKGYPPPRPTELEAKREMGNAGGGTLVIGSKATVLTGSHAGVPRVIPEVKMQEMARGMPKPNVRRSSHWDNWLRAIKGTEKTRSNFAYGGRLTELVHFGNIAMHVNRNLTLDPVARAIVSDEEATRLIAWPPPRKGWA